MAFHVDRMRGAGATGEWVPVVPSGLAGALRATVSPLGWRVAGILFLIAAEAVLYGYSYPFFSLALEKYGIANWLIGLNASLAGAGILIVGPLIPGLIRLLGLRLLVAGLFLVSLLSFAVLLSTDALFAWFAARFVMGACFAALWSTTEIWLNGVVDDRHRGRIIGASATLYAGAQFIGPLALSGVGVTGWVPLVTAMIPLAAGVVVALMIRSQPGEPAKAAERPEKLWLAFTLATPLIIAAFLAGVTETALQSLLPLYGLAHHMTDAQAAQLVALFSIGEAVLVAALGWGADRYGRQRTLGFCTLLAVVVMFLLPVSIYQFALLGPALFLAGGVISGIYTLGVIEIGQEHRGQRLAIVSTGFAMAYAAGAVVGSTPIGFAIDLFGPNALPVLISGCFFLMALTIVLRREQRFADTVPVARAEVVAAGATPRQRRVVAAPQFAIVATEDPLREVRESLEAALAAAVTEEVQALNTSLEPEADLAQRFRERTTALALWAAEREERRAAAYRQGADRDVQRRRPVAQPRVASRSGAVA